MFRSVKELDSAAENNGDNSDMIYVNHILFNKLPGNLRSSANPDVFPGLLSKFIYKSTYGDIAEANMISINAAVIMRYYESCRSHIGPMMRRQFRHNLVVSPFPHDDGINRGEERGECIFRFNRIILTFYPVHGAITVGDITIKAYCYIENYISFHLYLIMQLESVSIQFYSTLYSSISMQFHISPRHS